MKKIFRITVHLFAVATVVLAIAMAYVWGVMEGIGSQRPLIKELMEKESGLIVDFGLLKHPLWYPLLSIAFIFGVCWTAIALIALREKKKASGLVTHRRQQAKEQATF